MRDLRADRDLNVVMLLTQFMPEVFGGAEQQCLRLSRCLAERGVRPHILTTRSNHETPGEEVIDGIPVTRLWTSAPPQYGGRRILSSISYMRAVGRWIDSRRDTLDLVHCHQAKFNAWIGTYKASRLGIPSIVKPGSAGPNFDLFSLERKRFFYGRIAARTVARETSAFVAISQELMDDLANYGIAPDRRILIPNGVVLPHSDPAARQATRTAIRAGLGIAETERIAVFVGRMERQKNVATLLGAFARLKTAGIPGRLVLLGDGALLAEHRALADRLGLADRAIFTGRVDIVPDYLRAADLFVLPALAEGMSNAVLEAMSEGTPQVVSTVSGNTDLVIPGETGWLYGEPRDTEALTASLTEAFTCPDERLQKMAQATHARARDTFSIEVVADRYRRLYDALITKTAFA